MKVINNHETYGAIVYEENFWTGKKTITIDGKKAIKVGKNQFLCDNISIAIMGTMFTQVTLNINGTFFPICEKTKPIEYILAFMPLIFILIWSNIPSLVLIFPVVGGAIGGAISGAFGATSIMFMKSYKSIFGKLIVGLVTFIITVIVCYLIAMLL